MVQVGRHQCETQLRYAIASTKANLMNTQSPSFGPDDAGLICGYEFRANAAPRALSSRDAIAWLDKSKDSAHGVTAHETKNFVWLHFSLSHANAVQWMKANLPLPEEFYETVAEGLHSSRIEREGEALIAVFNDIHFDFDFEPSELAALWICARSNLVVTARRSPLRSVDNLRTAVKYGEQIDSSIALLTHLLHAQADVLVDVVRRVTLRIDTVEDDLLKGRPTPSQRAALGTLRRLLVRLQRVLAPEPGSLFRLLQNPTHWMPSGDVQALRESTEEFSVVLRDMSALQERIKLLQEEIAARASEENNRSLFTLTIVTVLALPINIIAGLLGMNVGGIPLAQHAYGFWIVIAIVVAFTVVAFGLAFRKPGRN
jgi:zinc transporter